MMNVTLPQPRLWRVDIEPMIRSDGFVLLVQHDEMGLEQIVVVDRQQLRDLATSVERTYREHERDIRRSKQVHA